jgi:AdoMet-dependent rRNA methyltransferase SPB1
VVCLGYKAPAKIDPRLLDPKHLFQEVAEAPKIMGPEALLKLKIKQKRHREGYEEGLSTSHKPLAAVEFLLSDAPVELLGRATKFELEGPRSEQLSSGDGDSTSSGSRRGLDIPALAAAVREAVGKDPEIRALCGDLQVLGRSEFKQLLKWRLALRKQLKPLLEAASEAAQSGSESGSESEEALDPEEKLLEEMAEVKERLEKAAKKEKKKRRELKQKGRVRAAQMAQGEGLGEDGDALGAGSERLFSLSSLPDVDPTTAAAAAEGGKKSRSKKGVKGDLLSQLADARALGEEELEAIEAPSSDEEMEVRGLWGGHEGLLSRA